MCGIFAFYKVNGSLSKMAIIEILLNGLCKLSNRGNDSAGLVVQTNEKHHFILKILGKAEQLGVLVKDTKLKFTEDYHDTQYIGIWKNINFSIENYSGNIEPTKDVASSGMGHTRWATHGEINIKNAHPQTIDDKFIVVHNGIIENALEIRKNFEGMGEILKSDTDTECILLLANYFYNQIEVKIEFPVLILMISKHFKGHNAFVVMSKYFPGEIVGLMNGSPLILGIKYKCIFSYNSSSEEREIGDDERDKLEIEELYLSSSPASLTEYTDSIVYLEEGDVIHIFNKNYKIFNSNENKGITPISRKISSMNIKLDEILTEVSDNYMLKEIYEQPKSVVKSMDQRIDFEKNIVNIKGLNEFIKHIRNSSKIFMIACGTSFHSALAVKSLYEKLLNISIQIEVSSDFVDRQPVILKTDTIFFISQSGETADTYLALKYCKNNQALCIGITNTTLSRISREVDVNIPINAGPEMSVASTKAYTSQFITLVLTALEICTSFDIEIIKIKHEVIQNLRRIPDQISEIFKMTHTIEKFCSDNFKGVNKMIILGRHVQYSTCLEAALKIKEICYIQSEGILSGELKHGPLALVDENIVCIQIIMNDSVLEKSKNAFNEIIARKGKPIIICTESIRQKLDDNIKCIVIPETTEHLQGILAIIPFQLISFFIAKQRNLNIDHPRNLAKTVTTE